MFNEVMKFKIHSEYKPAGDQPKAIETLTAGLRKGYKDQTLLGVTGSGKTFTMAGIIEKTQKPTLIISHNKTLAAQLYGEFRHFFPENAVHYFVSYYDYYQPEAYIPHTDTYIEKEATINEEIDRLRHASTQSLLFRDDVIVIASVSCIYGIGEKEDYLALGRFFFRGQKMKRNMILAELVKIQFERNEKEFYRGKFRVRGDTIDIFLVNGEFIVRIAMAGDTIEKITQFAVHPEDPKKPWMEGLYEKDGVELEKVMILPAKHYMAPEAKIKGAITGIRQELSLRLEILKKEKKDVEAYRLERKTNYDLEMIEQVGYCNGIENYSRHLSGREPGSPPSTLIDFFPKDYLLFIDESHVTLPQIRGMYAGDQSRKETLVSFGFRLPSAKDNRPLNFDEFREKINKVIYVSATPSVFEISNSKQIAEQIIRPTGLMDPAIEVRPGKNQLEDLIREIKLRVEKKQRALVTTLTKRMAEELAEYLTENLIKVKYLHSEIDTLDRVDILNDLRSGKVDVIVGINLLREGLDLPEVSLVAILDADMSGFLRNETSLLQTIGRAARNVDGKVIMYAEKTTPAMSFAISETNRRRKRQEEYNIAHGITPKTIIKELSKKLLET
jgi:excinuclease ABC subunit B